MDEKTLKDLHQLTDNMLMLHDRHAWDSVDHAGEIGLHVHPISLNAKSVGTAAVMYARRSGQK
jgi:hypothetical protein